MSVVRYRKLPIPVEVDTVQWTGTNLAELIAFTGGDFFLTDPGEFTDPEFTATVYDSLHHTWVGVKTGQTIVQGPKGETYPIDADVLAETYEPVTEDGDFFQTGRTYTRQVHGERAEFRVDHIATHPDGHPVAFGWYRRAPKTSWHAYSSDDFHGCGWTDVTEGEDQ